MESLMDDARKGRVLVPGTILKAEHFTSNLIDGCVSLDGAPHFRKTKAPLPIYGAAQPTVYGLKNTLKYLGHGPNHDIGVVCGKTGNYRKPLSELLRPTNVAGTVCNENSSSIKKKPLIWLTSREEPLVYINENPFVLREKAHPLQNIRAYCGIAASRLEQIEENLCEDIWRESSLNDGFLVIHKEDSDGKIQPVLLAVDSVESTSQVFMRINFAGFNVSYHRVPISRDHGTTESFIDDYLRHISRFPTTNVVFSCGMGITRTTYSMILALVIRRIGLAVFTSKKIEMNHQRLRKILKANSQHNSYAEISSESCSVIHSNLEAQAIDVAKNLSMAISGDYHIIIALVRSFESGPMCKELVDQAIDDCDEFMHLRGSILSKFLGHFQNDLNQADNDLEMACRFLEIYFTLIAFSIYLIDSGFSKTLVGKILVDLEYTIKISDHESPSSLISEDSKSIECIKLQKSFREWLELHRDARSLLNMIRKRTNIVNVFRPLSIISLDTLALVPKFLENDVYQDVDTKKPSKESCTSLLLQDLVLKMDRIKTFEDAITLVRRIDGSNLWATPQPNLSELVSIIKIIMEKCTLNSEPMNERLLYGPDISSGIMKKDHITNPLVITWVNVREEPLMYIEGVPYVFRDEKSLINNIKTHAGITSKRLELMEERIRSQIIEHSLSENQVKVIVETTDGTIREEDIPLIGDGSLKTCKGIFDELFFSLQSLESKKKFLDSSENSNADSLMPIVDNNSANLIYRRVPMTPEDSAYPLVIDSLVEVIKEAPKDSHIVFNCHTGAARSTMCTVVALLVQQSNMTTNVSSTSKNFTDTPIENLSVENSNPINDVSSHYHLINSLLRIIPDGGACKLIVDRAIDRCAQVVNLRTCIEDYRLDASSLEDDDNDDNDEKKATDNQQSEDTIFGMSNTTLPHKDFKESFGTIHENLLSNGERQSKKVQIAKKSVHGLIRYAMILLLQFYLSSSTVKNNGTKFSVWLHDFPEIFRLIKLARRESHVEMVHSDDPIKFFSSPLEVTDSGSSDSDVPIMSTRRRRGSVLAPYTILKFDHFRGCQNLKLVEKLSGAPNFRVIKIKLEESKPLHIIGLAMPTIDGVQAVLARVRELMSETGYGSVKWVCMREEPVIYINGRPFVLRIVKDPISNLETTGIISDRVEEIENRLRQEILEELQTSDKNATFLKPIIQKSPIPKLVDEYVDSSCTISSDNFPDHKPQSISDKIRTTGKLFSNKSLQNSRNETFTTEYFSDYSSIKACKLLLHDEDEATGQVIPIYESVTECAVESTRSLMERIFLETCSENLKFSDDLNIANNQNYDMSPLPTGSISFHRVPVTDEQSPSPEIFDHLIELVDRTASMSDSLDSSNIIKEKDEPSVIIFNCQMGRGRTTTGMIVAYLVYMCRHKSISTLEYNSAYQQESSANSENCPSNEKKLLNGEYLIVRQLMHILYNGHMAKQVADDAIDTCSQMQNLRTAIYSFRELGKSDARTLARGINYLLRYAFIIVLCDYLLLKNKMDDVERRDQTFSRYLASHREITNLLSNTTLHQLD